MAFQIEELNRRAHIKKKLKVTLTCFVAVLFAAIGCSDDQADNPTAGTPSTSGSGPGSVDQLSKTTVVNYTVPAGNQILLFDTGQRGPLFDLQIVVGGSPQVKISHIVGTTNQQPEVTFEPPVAPFEVTRFFLQNPLTSESTSFQFFVNNTSASDQRLQIGARWE